MLCCICRACGSQDPVDSVFCIGNSREVFDPVFDFLVPRDAARMAETNNELAAKLGVKVGVPTGCLSCHSARRGNARAPYRPTTHASPPPPCRHSVLVFHCLPPYHYQPAYHPYVEVY